MTTTTENQQEQQQEQPVDIDSLTNTEKLRIYDAAVIKIFHEKRIIDAEYRKLTTSQGEFKL